jgi:glutaredoxin
MEFIAPFENGFTIYSKSGCPYCRKVKELLSEFEKEVTVVDCDDYLIECKDAFLEYIGELAGKEYKTFPIVFSAGKFVGGYTDTLTLLNQEEED